MKIFYNDREYIDTDKLTMVERSEDAKRVRIVCKGGFDKWFSGDEAKRLWAQITEFSETIRYELLRKYVEREAKKE